MPDITADQFERIVTIFVPETVSSLTISRGGDFMAVAAGDKLHIHAIPATAADSAVSASDFPRLVTLYMPDTIQAVTFSPDGKLIFVAIGDKVHVYRVPR